MPFDARFRALDVTPTLVLCIISYYTVYLLIILPRLIASRIVLASEFLYNYRWKKQELYPVEVIQSHSDVLQRLFERITAVLKRNFQNRNFFLVWNVRCYHDYFICYAILIANIFIGTTVIVFLNFQFLFLYTRIERD